MSYANPPPELQNAINSSSQRYGVPADILTGVWRIESGSSFPNNYVNSSGYGGLFGTKNWNGSTQSQSDYAASILANLYNQNGSWSKALYHYSGGGYQSVPGQTTPGGAQQNPRPGNATTGQATGSNNPLDVGGAINNLGSTIGNIPNTIISDFKPVAIGAGFGILGILLIVGGIIVIALTFGNKVAEQPIVQTAVEAIP